MSTIDFQHELFEMGRCVRAAARRLALMSAAQKNRCLDAMAAKLSEQDERIREANRRDLENGAKNGLSSAMLDRLALTEKRMSDMIKSIQTLKGVADPVGRVDSTWLRPNGLKIQKVRVPIGVIAIIYESRPNVTVDAATLCMKAGNGVFLRGGSEAIHSNRALVDAMLEGGAEADLPAGALQFVPWTDREAVQHLLKMDKYIDLVIPRGGEGLIRTVVENATIPVIKHYKGVCHIYVDSEADIEMALRIVENAKCQRPGVCNAAETVLIHKDIAPQFAARMAQRLQTNGVTLIGDEQLRHYVPDAAVASEQDWYEEYLDLRLAVRVVESFDQAVDHIATYGSAHSDAIVTDNKKTATRFTEAVDSAVVYVNASTRFTDGGQFGMGAEIGISTDRIHARGPMGVDELTSYKYVAFGTGQIRE